MSLSHFNAPKHPSEFQPIKYLPYEILKIQRQNSENSQVFEKVYDSVLEGFEKVETEEISEEQRILVSHVVDEITSVRSREVRKQVIGEERELLEVALMEVVRERRGGQEVFAEYDHFADEGKVAGDSVEVEVRFDGQNHQTNSDVDNEETISEGAQGRKGPRADHSLVQNAQHAVDYYE